MRMIGYLQLDQDFAGENREKVLGADLRRAPLHWVLPNESLGLVGMGRVDVRWCYAFWLERLCHEVSTHIFRSISYVHTCWLVNAAAGVTKMRKSFGLTSLTSHPSHCTCWRFEDEQVVEFGGRAGRRGCMLTWIQAAFRHTRMRLTYDLRWGGLLGSYYYGSFQFSAKYRYCFDGWRPPSTDFSHLNFSSVCGWSE